MSWELRSWFLLLLSGGRRGTPLTCPCGLRNRKLRGCPRLEVSCGGSAPEACLGTWPHGPCSGWCGCGIVGRRSAWSSSKTTHLWKPESFRPSRAIAYRIGDSSKAGRTWTISEHHHTEFEHKRREVQYISLLSPPAQKKRAARRRPVQVN